MLRSFAAQAPKIAAWGSRNASTNGTDHNNNNSIADGNKRLKRRLEVDFDELMVMQCLEDVTLIDVRQPAELNSQEQIPGSLNIPLGNLKEVFQLSPSEWQHRFNREKPSKSDKAVVFYARGSIASGAALEIAHRMGYKKSRHYSGGWEDYCEKNNLPVVKPKHPEIFDPLQQQFNYHYFDPELHFAK